MCIVPYRLRYIRHICDVNDVYRVMMYCSVSLKHTSDSSRSVSLFCTQNVWCIYRVNLWRLNAPEYVYGDNYTELQYECNIINKDMVNYWLNKCGRVLLSAKYEVPQILSPSKFRYCIYRSPKVNWNMTQLNPICVKIFYYKDTFDIVFSFMPGVKGSYIISCFD